MRAICAAAGGYAPAAIEILSKQVLQAARIKKAWQGQETLSDFWLAAFALAQFFFNGLVQRAAAGWARCLTNYCIFWQIAPARSGRAAVRLEPVLGGAYPV
jgi:hypothetical protein